MKKLELELNDAGFREILKSPEVAALCSQKAAEIKGRCGTGYETKDVTAPTRAYSVVYADTYKARKDNLENNTIARSLR